MKTLRIDIVSDVVCPWCIVGYRQLAIALEQTGIEADIHWHPFELNPDMPHEGQDLVEHIAEKYGSSKAESDANRQRLVDIGRELDFTFDYRDGKKMVPTFRAHQLLHWADESGKEHQLKQALFTAYFTHDRNIDNPEVLIELARDCGLDADEAQRVLEDERHAAVVRERERFWIERGIRGVPAMVFEEQHLLTGAQGVDRYVTVLEQLTSTVDA